MNYIVFDLEWNQSNRGKERECTELSFEIIEIGAVKLNENFETEDEFNRLIKPQVYSEMNYITGNLLHLKMKELVNEEYFTDVVSKFIDWCGEDVIFCTWGPSDLSELQKNMRYYGMPPLHDRPIKFYDIQKLFSIGYEDRKSRRTLEYAVDFLSIEKDIPFHRAFSDAYYTAKILGRLAENGVSVFRNYSFDVFSAPRTKKEEIKVVFDNYAKYISREFESKEELLSDREVMSNKCYICKNNIKRKIKWFSPNGKHYFSVGYCSVHGYVKAKVRIRKSENNKLYAVKTTKFISEAEMNCIKMRQTKTKHHAKYKHDK